MIDATLTSELETIFRDEFLKAAPLYSAARKIKLPYEDIKSSTVMYRGSLSEQTRTVESIADYHLFKGENPTLDELNETVGKLASSAGNVVDGLIRIENVRNLKESDPRQTNSLCVTDIFEHADGRRNLQVMYVFSKGPTVSDPAGIVQSWVAYRFYFAVAAIKQEYKASVAAQSN